MYVFLRFILLMNKDYILQIFVIIFFFFFREKEKFQIPLWRLKIFRPKNNIMIKII